MTWLFAFLGTAVVVVIALVAVGSAVRRLAATALPAVLEVDDAVDWIADRLPVEAAGQLSRENVVSVVGWYLEVFAEAGLATEYGQELGEAAFEDDAGDLSQDPAGRMAALDGALEHVVARGLDQAEPLDAVSVAMVADLLGTYLEEMGAFRKAGPPEDDPGRD